HYIEQKLWVDGATNGLSSYTKDLNDNVATLQNLVKDVDLQPAGIANGEVEDHRGRGAVLAHRLRRLRGQRPGRGGGLRRGEADPAEEEPAARRRPRRELRGGVRSAPAVQDR